MNNEFPIKTSVDAAGVPSGVNATVGGLKQIEAATGQAAAATAELMTEQERAVQISQEYGVSMDVAAKTVALLGAASAHAAVGSDEMDEALASVQMQLQAASAQQAAYNTELEASAAALTAEFGAIDAATALTEKLGLATGTTSAALKRLGLSEIEVATMADKMGVSFEIAARAMMQIKNAAIADEVATARAQIEALTVATTEEAVSAEASAVANDVDAEALARRAIMMRRTTDGLVDIGMGGRRAIQGVADLQYVLTSLLPEFAGIIAVVGGLSLALEILGRTHRGAGEEAKNHAASEKELSDAIDKSTQSLIDSATAATKVHYEVLTQQIKALVAAQKEMIDQQKQWDENADSRLKYLQNETEATQKLALAQMEHQKQLDLNAATSDEQREVIEADYKRREIGMSGADTQQANLAEQTLLAQQKQEDDAERALYLKTNRDNDALIKQYKDDADAKTQKAIGSGFTPNEAGEFTEKQIKDQEEKVKAAAKDLATAGTLTWGDTLAQMDVDAGIGTKGEKEQIAAKSAERDSAQTRYTKEQSRLDDLTDAKTSRDAFNANIKQWQENVSSNSKVIGQLTSKLDEIYSKERVLSTESRTTAVTTGTDQLAADAEADKAQSDLHWKAWKGAVRDTTKSYRESQHSQRVTRQEETAEEKARREQIENLAGQIEATGNKPMIEAMRRVLDVFRGKTDEASQLNEIGRLAAVMAGDYANFKAATTQHISDLRASVNKLK